MIEIKISGGTPRSGKPLCLTCKRGTHVTGQNCEERIICGADIFNSTNGVVTMRVSSCGSYDPSNVPWLHEMEQMAWKIEARKRGPKGFENPDGELMEVVIKKPQHNAMPSE
jgi:hypothetical protein